MEALFSSVPYFPIEPGELMAVLSSLIYAGTLLSIRRGMEGGTPLAAVLAINLIVCVCGLSTAFLQGTLQESSLVPLLWFALTGVLGQGIGTITHFIGIERMGVSRSTLIQSITPIWSTIFAVVVLDERPAMMVILGTLSIVYGIGLISTPEGEEGRDLRSWWKGALIFPLISSVVYALAPIFSKFGYAHQQTPLVALGVAYTFGLVTLFVARPFLPGGGYVGASRTSIRWFIFGGVLNFAGACLFWTAVLVGDISTVIPVSRLYPFWVVMFGAFFLRRLERITLRVFVAAVLIVGGAISVTAIRG